MQPTKRERRAIDVSLLIVRIGLDGGLVRPADFRTALIDLGQTHPGMILTMAREQAKLLGVTT